MKKNLLTLFAGLSLSFGFAQSTATNFTATDCASASHTLFTELNGGNVIVVCWVMPCGACITGASNSASAVQSFASSNPGQVKFYLVDDAGNTSCSTLSSWASTNSITADAKFGNSGNVIKMSDYGTSGMPKIVVLGGSSHTVYYNVNGSGSVSAISSAITTALNSMTGIAEPVSSVSSLNVFPNPASVSSSVSYSLETPSAVSVELYNMVGAKVKTIFSGNQTTGDYEMDIDCAKLQNGIYFVKLSAGKVEKTIMLSVSH